MSGIANVCVSMLLLSNKLPETWCLNTCLLPHSFCRTEVPQSSAGSWLQVSNSGCQQLSSQLSLWGRSCFHGHSGCWQNSIPCGCRIEICFLDICWGQLPRRGRSKFRAMGLVTGHVVTSRWQQGPSCRGALTLHVRSTWIVAKS